MDQQSLSLSLKPHTDFAHYYAGPNRLVVNTLMRLGAGDFIYVWGESGLGVSHLLQACSEAAERGGKRAMYLDLKPHEHLASEMLDGLETYDVIALDHLDAIVGRPQWEQAIFHLYNRCQAAEHSLLIGAHVAPLALSLGLADLASRLKAMLVLPLKPLNDQDKLIALQQRAQDLGLDLPNEVGQFLLSRCDRQLAALLQLLAYLDQASLRAQRKLTVPFVKQVLAT
jgi:DnaA family protein